MNRRYVQAHCGVLRLLLLYALCALGPSACISLNAMPCDSKADCIDGELCCASACTEGVACPEEGTGGAGGQSELCERPAPKNHGATLQCGVGDFKPVGLSFSVRVSPDAPFDPHAEVSVAFDAKVIIPPETGELFVAHGTDHAKLSEARVEIQLTGAVPSLISLRVGPGIYDLDENDDGVAEQTVVSIPVDPVRVIAESGQRVDFALRHLEVSLSDVPTFGIGDLTVSNDEERSMLDCSMSSGSVSFPVCDPALR